MTTAQKAEARLKAAKLRTLAVNQRAMAARYERQAAHAAYPGQDVICLNKASQVAALASENEAAANLILAQAGL